MRTGVFISRDHGTIANAIDLDALAAGVHGVEATSVVDSFLDERSQQALLKVVADRHLEAVVLAGDSLETIQKSPEGARLLEALYAKGVNPTRVASANLKEHVALPFGKRPAIAARNARLLLEAAVLQATTAPAVPIVTLTPKRSVLVLGATAGGWAAVQALRRHKLEVFLCDEAGDTPAAQTTASGAKAEALRADGGAKVFTESHLVDVFGRAGGYSVRLEGPLGTFDIQVGGIAVAIPGLGDRLATLKHLLGFDMDAAGAPRTDSAGATADPGVRYLGDTATDDDAERVVAGLAAVLDRPTLNYPVLAPTVNVDDCGGCATCVKTCAFGASAVDWTQRLSSVDNDRCRSCGNCVVSCPTGARRLPAYPEPFVLGAVDAFGAGLRASDTPRILALLCRHCGLSASEEAGRLSVEREDLRLPDGYLPIVLECGGAIDTQFVLRAFRAGLDGVVLGICPDGYCHHDVGNTDADRRIGLFREVLRSRGIDDARIRVIHAHCGEGEAFALEVRAFADELTAAGRTH